MRSPFHRPLWVGLNPNTPQGMSQATIWVEFRDGITKVVSAKTIPAIIQPASTVSKGLTYYSHREVVNQLRKMGVEPTSIEVYGKDHTYVYDAHTYSLLYREPRYKETHPVSIDEVSQARA